ncbi:MAG: M20/M25/M40 family metallo-hydrolase [Solirubrobacterales bacterium]
MINRNRIVAEFLELAAIDSVSYHEARVRDVLIQKLTELGFSVYEDEANRPTGGESGNLIAHLPGTAEGPGVFFCAHMDTVQPGIGIVPILDGDVIRSAGDTVLGADDKAGIAVILEAIRVIKEKRISHPELEVIFTVSEEQGLMGARHLDITRLRSAGGYVLDTNGPAGTIVVQGPTQNELEIEVRGKAAHAGINPEDGLNAIHAAGYAIANLTIGRIDHETTCNLGTIQGGEARNIVPDRVVIKGEVRSLDETKLEQVTNRIEAEVKARCAEKGAECQIRITPLYPAFRLDPASPVVLAAANAARNIGKEPIITKTGGGSDANLLNGRGMPTANIGVGFEHVHTVEERIQIQSLVDCAAWVVEIIKESAGKKL